MADLRKTTFKSVNQNQRYCHRSLRPYAIQSMRGRPGPSNRPICRCKEDIKNDCESSNAIDQEEKSRNVCIVQRKDLEELFTKDSRILVLTLQDKWFGFKELLSLPSIKEDMFVLTIKALATASSCTLCPENLMALLNDALSSNLFSRHIPEFLSSALASDMKESLPGVLQDMAVLFNKVLISFPYKAGEQLGISVLIVKNIIESHKRMGKELNEDIYASFHEIDQRRCELLQTYDAKTREKKVQEESKIAQPPPDDFRALSVTPTIADIHEIVEPFLRPNIESGAFMSVDHYLDVHFRLLREDFIGPLRDGLVNYLSLVSRGKLHELKAKEIKIYHDVHVTFPECYPNNGVCQRLSFDVNRLLSVRWDSTKRLLHGSLVCLSDNNFVDFFLATIVKRDPETLREGIVTVKFVGDLQKAWVIEPSRSFIMIESPVYFEAVSPVLKALQTINSDSMPFKDNIISANRNVDAPHYLSENSEYDLTSLVNTEPREKKRRNTFDVLDSESWPSSEDLSFDVAQYTAFKTALTQKIAIIQGPPGTGKTFLGLKIVEVLIRNTNVWSDDSKSILVICYTNHALDQFLEGMLKFVPNGIVRVGGQSKSEVLSQFNLNNLRKRNVYEFRSLNRRLLLNKMSYVEDQIIDLLSPLYCPESWMMSENLLENYIQPEHYNQLMKNDYFNKRSSISQIAEWLGLDISQVDRRQAKRNKKSSSRLPFHLEDADEDQVYDVLAREEMERRIVNDSWDDIRLTTSQKMRRHLDSMKDNCMFTVVAEEPENKWHTQGGKKKVLNIMREEMRKSTTMTDEEERSVAHIMVLPLHDRWRLYRHWISKFRADVQQRARKLLEEYEINFKQLKEVAREVDVAILKKAKIIGMTTTGAAKCRDVLQIIGPKIVIVEEAAEVLESHIITALTPHCEHLILIGDQQQLRPNITLYKLAKRYKLDVSLFERLIKNGFPYERLEVQHRMKPNIAALLVPHIYLNLKNHPSVEEYEMIRGVSSSLYFVNHEYRESTALDSTSLANEFEANFIVQFCCYLIHQEYQETQITILTTYLAQLFSIKQKIKNTIARYVRCTVVDNFQGEENDIILLSLVRSNEEGKVGFLRVDNRVCVALSRARKGLFCFGNFDFLQENSKVWKPIVSYVKKNGLIGKNLILHCQNHPKIMAEVGCAEDFEKVPQGGCKLPCEFRLPCGHQCSMLCHPYNLKHENFQCRKPCKEVLCELSHRCPKQCWEICGPCIVPMSKEFRCGHTNIVPCHKDPADVRCVCPCERPMSCGHPSHKCNKECWEDCGPCMVPMSKQFSCGHTNIAPCHRDPATTRCENACGRLLSCGHKCNKMCWEDCGPCMVRMSKEFSCGHTNMLPCCVDPAAAYCKQACKRRLPCGHPCKSPCGEDCDASLCDVKIVTQSPCGHTVEFNCNDRKDEMSLPSSCKESCFSLLPCGHRCSGSCGQCFQGRFHKQCMQKCERTLICGHSCDLPCFRKCQICKKQCQNRCSHKQCSKKCGLPCDPCTQPCVWQCMHYTCTKQCSDFCDRPRCDKPCTNNLRCGHPCIGLCGEPCPHLCRICDKDKVNKIVFGLEDEENARFVLLEDCHHIFEVNWMDKWMERGLQPDTDGGDIIIEMVSCPKCNMVVRRSLRYGNIVKQISNDLLTIKTNMFSEHHILPTKCLKPKIQSLNIPQRFRRKGWQLLLPNFRYLMKQFNIALTNQDVNTYDTFYLYLKHIRDLWPGVNSDRQHWTKVESTEIDSRITHLLKRHLGLDRSSGERAVFDFSREFCRLNHIMQIMSARKDDGSFSEKQPLLDRMLKILMGYQPYTEEMEALIVKYLEDLGVTADTMELVKRIEISNFIGLTKGCWFKCRNGHFYGIGECGSAKQRGECVECKKVEEMIVIDSVGCSEEDEPMIE